MIHTKLVSRDFIHPYNHIYLTLIHNNVYVQRFICNMYMNIMCMYSNYNLSFVIYYIRIKPKTICKYPYDIQWYVVLLLVWCDDLMFEIFSVFLAWFIQVNGSFFILFIYKKLYNLLDFLFLVSIWFNTHMCILCVCVTKKLWLSR